MRIGALAIKVIDLLLNAINLTKSVGLSRSREHPHS
jgi:hypothetical protein